MDARENTVVFQAGTTREEGRLVTAGGRVLAVTGLSPQLAGALARAYAGVAAIHFEGAHYRRDIGQAEPVPMQGGVDGRS